MNTRHPSSKPARSGHLYDLILATRPQTHHWLAAFELVSRMGRQVLNRPHPTELSANTNGFKFYVRYEFDLPRGIRITLTPFEDASVHQRHDHLTRSRWYPQAGVDQLTPPTSRSLPGFRPTDGQNEKRAVLTVLSAATSLVQPQHQLINSND